MLITRESFVNITSNLHHPLHTRAMHIEHNGVSIYYINNKNN